MISDHDVVVNARTRFSPGRNRRASLAVTRSRRNEGGHRHRDQILDSPSLDRMCNVNVTRQGSSTFLPIASGDTKLEKRARGSRLLAVRGVREGTGRQLEVGHATSLSRDPPAIVDRLFAGRAICFFWKKRRRCSLSERECLDRAPCVDPGIRVTRRPT